MLQKITRDILKQIYKPRPQQSKKYDYGLLVVIGGSQFYSGSPALSAMAAFRAGVDMVRILAPKRPADIIATFSPDLATFPLKGDYLDKEDLADLIALTRAAQEVSNNKTAVVIGGGIGRSEATKEVVREFLSQIDAPVVIDADGIHAVAGVPSLVAGRNFLLTPHLYEFFALTGSEVAGLALEQQAAMVQAEALRFQTTIVLKGRTDIIAAGDGKTAAINETGTPMMAKGGTGDTLAGIAGAILARGLDTFTAGCGAAYINGRAGELAAKKFGEGLMATDVIKEIPEAIRI